MIISITNNANKVSMHKLILIKYILNFDHDRLFFLVSSAIQQPYNLIHPIFITASTK